MSIVTLKRATASKYNNMSVNKKQFSLNGTHRSQGFVGQTSLSRSLPRTLMRGNTIRGHGGFNGTYPVKPVVTEGTGLGTNMLNNPNVVKSSVLDTNGQQMTRNKWIRRPYPHTAVKPDTTSHIQNQGEYTDFLRKRTMYQIATQEKKNPPPPGKINNCCKMSISPTGTYYDYMYWLDHPDHSYAKYSDIMRTNYRTKMTANASNTIAKPDKVTTQSNYLSTLVNNKCTHHDFCTTKNIRPSRGNAFISNRISNVSYCRPPPMWRKTWSLNSAP